MSLLSLLPAEIVWEIEGYVQFLHHQEIRTYFKSSVAPHIHLLEDAVYSSLKEEQNYHIWTCTPSDEIVYQIMELYITENDIRSYINHLPGFPKMSCIVRDFLILATTSYELPNYNRLFEPVLTRYLNSFTTFLRANQDLIVQHITLDRLRLTNMIIKSPMFVCIVNVVKFCNNGGILHYYDL